MRKLQVVTAIALFLLSSCRRPPESPQEVAFAAQFPFQILPGLRLSDPHVKRYGNFFSITMGLDNESGEYIWFPTYRCGARSLIYSESEGRWIELQDRGIEVSSREMVLPPRGKGDWWFTIIGVDPSLPPDVQPPVTIRVIVVGRIYRDGRPTDREVGTYLDVTLQP